MKQSRFTVTHEKSIPEDSGDWQTILKQIPVPIPEFMEAAQALLFVIYENHHESLGELAATFEAGYQTAEEVPETVRGDLCNILTALAGIAFLVMEAYGKSVGFPNEPLYDSRGRTH